MSLALMRNAMGFPVMNCDYSLGMIAFFIGRNIGDEDFDLIMAACVCVVHYFHSRRQKRI